MELRNSFIQMRQTVLNVVNNGGTFIVHKYSYRDESKRKLLRRMAKSGLVKLDRAFPDKKWFAYIKSEEINEQ